MNTPSNLESRFSTKLEKEKSLKPLLNLVEKLPGLELFLVGGMVRDIILNAEEYKTDRVTSKDYDFVARGVNIDDLTDALAPLGNVNLVGRNFGVIKFSPADSTLAEAIDIALPRKDLAFGTGGYRDFEAQADANLAIEDDLSRRDLTINAMAYDIKNQIIIDPFHGRDDIKNKIIRAAGQPDQRFGEDYSRILRAIRFACRLDFTIEPKTWDAMLTLMPKLNKARNDQGDRLVPMETISKEILKSLEKNPVRAMDLLDQSGAIKEFMPELLTMKNCPQPPEFHAEGDVWTHTKLALQELSSPEFKKQFPDHRDDGTLALAVLFHDLGKPLTIQTPELNGTDRIRFNGHDLAGAESAAKICRRLRLSNDQIEKIVYVIREHMFAMHSNMAAISPHKIAKRFLDSPHGHDLLKLLYVDASASRRPDGQVPLGNFGIIESRLEEIKRLRASQPEKIISGDSIMEILKIKSGPLIGLIVELLSELKDLGKINSESEAREFLIKHQAALLKYQKFAPADKEVIKETFLS